MGRTPTEGQIAKLKHLSILGPKETDELIAELVKITERVETPQELPDDIRRFTEILILMLPDATLGKVHELLKKKMLN